MITDSTVQYGADIMGFLQRPTNTQNKYRNNILPEAAKEGEVLQSQLVEYKICLEVKLTEQCQNGLNTLRSRETKGNSETQMKRAILCCRDLTKYRLVDIFDGLSEADVSSFDWSLTSSQKDFIFPSCRQVFSGIG